MIYCDIIGLNRYNKRFKTRNELSDYLTISPRIQQRWTKQYVDYGIEGLLTDEP
ncbi:hypothetical protein [Psychroflexus sp. MES1-P1E]|uniref:hypothetical protein n=1 Tax=Psychroflexus sp. MES1-P1E TaxID=2058320 RepID=UPI0015E0B2DD|nr:hypothetical protein [Psychroflexus sp. MES1-P1E]